MVNEQSNKPVRQSFRVKAGIGLVVGLLVCVAGNAAPTETIVIHAGHLIAEPGQPIKDRQSVIVEDGKVVAIKDGFVRGKKVIDLTQSWVMPGLIDMHTHITGQLDLDHATGIQIAAFYMRPQAELVLEALPRLKAVLMNGFTTVRNLGDPTFTSYALRDAVEAGTIVGPRLLGTEAQITVDGGDFDASKMGLRAEFDKHVSNRGNCTGVDQCIKVVRVEVNRGADVVKLRQAGLNASNPKISMVENESEVRAVIDTAHKLDRRVAVHVNGSPEFLHMVIADGADTIEHGPLDAVAIKMMKQHGTAFTPTLLAAKMINYRFDDASKGALKAFQAGVPIIFGTDLGIMGPKEMHEEFSLLAAAGIPPEQVLRSATVNAAVALGRADSLGSIAPGKAADLIAMKVDPIRNIDQLGKEEAVTFVMKDGVVFKSDR